jgi:hypothetical protein
MLIKKLVYKPKIGDCLYKHDSNGRKKIKVLSPEELNFYAGQRWCWDINEDGEWVSYYIGPPRP